MSPEPVLLTERRGKVLVITISRPAQRNAINQEVATCLSQALQDLDDDPELAVGVLTGAAQTFSAGMDLKALARGEGARMPGRGFAGIVEQPPAKPMIAAVEGWALGGGFEIALACDLIVASDSARFGLPEVRRGIVAAGGGVLRLPRYLPRAIAMELILTGGVLEAVRAERLGLINRLVPEGQALSTAIELAEVIAHNAPLAVVASKEVLLQSADWETTSAFALQRLVFEPVFASADAREGALAFTEKREPSWSGR